MLGERLKYGCGSHQPFARMALIGQKRSYDRSKLRRADDRFQSAAGIGQRAINDACSPNHRSSLCRLLETA
jgi:hypothetical protein